MLQKLLEQKSWNPESSFVWREIVSRWGEADYEDKTKREAHKETLKKEWEEYQWGRNRKKTFPELEEQLDMLFHDMTAGKGTKDGEWYKAIVKVKADNPKPTE